jgi:hypothetical protein
MEWKKAAAFEKSGAKLLRLLSRDLAALPGQFQTFFRLRAASLFLQKKNGFLTPSQVQRSSR